MPFVERGVPSIDVIDLDYGPNNSYHHTAQDTMDKISAHSLMIDGDVFMESIRLIDQKSAGSFQPSALSWDLLKLPLTGHAKC